MLHCSMVRDIILQDFVETRNVVRIFGKKSSAVNALDGVSVKIGEGEIFGLLGPNGAGKTTLIKILTTLLLPNSGEAYVGGFSVVKEPEKVRGIINLVSGGETPGYGILSVSENLWFFSQLYGLSSSAAKEKIKQLEVDLDIEKFGNTRMAKLSTGYKQRMSLARGLLNDPKILFLDEPTLGLDVLTAKRLRTYVIDWAKRERKGTVLLTTHYMAEADEMCDRVAIINNGRILACGSSQKLKDELRETPIAKIEVASTQDDYQFIEKMQGVVGFSENRNIQTGVTTLKVMVQDRCTISQIEAKLNEKKLKLLSSNETEPTLEDVYIRHVGKGFAEVEEKANA